MNGLRRKMRCVMCGTIVLSTVTQAKEHGWTLWFGGALCKGCRAKGEAAAVPAPGAPAWRSSLADAVARRRAKGAKHGV